MNGFELFQGCNQLQIEYAWTEQLFVRVNDINRSWDYTKSPYQAVPQQGYPAFASTGYPQAAINCVYDAAYQNYMPHDNYYNHNMMHHDGGEMSSHQPLITFATSPQYQPNVMLVSGLNYETSNTDMLFNLLSLYGNVSRIQFLPNKQGSALVQMFDRMSVECCIQHLDKAPIGQHGRLHVHWANQAFNLNSSSNSFLLPDGSRNCRDYAHSKNQRFLKPRPVYWIQSPSKIVRFYNMPPFTTKELLFSVFQEKNVLPVDANVLPAFDDSRSTRGLLEFQSVSQAILAVMKCNNKEIKTTPKHSFFMKLCFSSSQTVELKT